MKRILLCLASLLLVFALCSCNEKTNNPADNSSGETNEISTLSPDDTKNDKTLVAYFSATGSTKVIAEKIAKAENCELYEIIPEKEYTSSDLNWHDNGSRTTKEQNDKSARPAIKSEKINIDNYKTIYIGFPIWWGEEPRIMDTFVESYNLSGKTVIPFSTSGSSDISKAETNLKQIANGGEWKNGKRFGAAAEDSEITSFIEEVK
ncbi:MAG: flavodoxin [Clostridia bacterium]|nr:flavodoxin [Clostridia bacterium]